MQGQILQHFFQIALKTFNKNSRTHKSIICILNRYKFPYPPLLNIKLEYKKALPGAVYFQENKNLRIQSKFSLNLFRLNPHSLAAFKKLSHNLKNVFPFYKILPLYDNFLNFRKEFLSALTKIYLKNPFSINLYTLKST
jgi:hypothetical protein